MADATAATIAAKLRETYYESYLRSGQISQLHDMAALIDRAIDFEEFQAEQNSTDSESTEDAIGAWRTMQALLGGLIGRHQARVRALSARVVELDHRLKLAREAEGIF